jgi:hypothetical protein
MVSRYSYKIPKECPQMQIQWTWTLREDGEMSDTLSVYRNSSMARKTS